MDHQAVDCSILDKNITDEEFNNFMHRVTEVEKIIKKMTSSDIEEQKEGELLADIMLKKKKEIDGSEELKVKTNRTVINKYTNDKSPDEISKEMFMKSVEKDAQERAEDRKVRNERADTFKRIGNGAFNEKDFEKAITFYGKAIEQRKDSTVIWNNRALSYMKLGLYEKALEDCEWALKVNDSNIKALLNSAKCHAYLGNNVKRDEFILMAKERVPRFTQYIKDFEAALKDNVTVDNEDEV